MVAHIIDVPLEIKIIRKLLLMLPKEGISVLMIFLIVNEVEVSPACCVSGKSIPIFQTLFKPSIS
jgi:hypothetical protein